MIDIGFAQLEHAARLEHVLVVPGAHLEVLALSDAAPHVFGQRRSQQQRTSHAVAAALKVAIAQGDPVQRQLLEGLTRQQPVRLEGARQHVALEDQPGLQKRIAASGLGQAIQRHRRLIPAPVLPALQIVQHAAPIEHRRRITKGERLGPCRHGWRCRRGRGQLVGQHQEISMKPELRAVRPSSGSFCSAWNSAHARSAWPVSSERPAVKVDWRPLAVIVLRMAINDCATSVQPASNSSRPL
ncbi:hypothetical protein DK27_21655 [Xanthomonas arboricola pv. pruni]|nr:hypothetical protein DK27_21655 [Xanthomonas arboricola pv. pruni]